MFILSLGLPREGQTQFALGLSCQGKTLLTVWNCGEKAHISLPLPKKYTHAEILYPVSLPGKCRLQSGGKLLSVELEGKTARIFVLTPET